MFQTDGLPPNHGRTYLPIMSCTWNSRNALRKIVATYQLAKGAHFERAVTSVAGIASVAIEDGILSMLAESFVLVL